VREGGRGNRSVRDGWVFRGIARAGDGDGAAFRGGRGKAKGGQGRG
jgi:hypothetical protein